MRKRTRLVALLSSFVLTLAVYSVAATSSNSKNSTTKVATQASTKSSTTANKSTAKHTEKSKAKHLHALASPEDLSGTISAVDPSGKEVTVIGQNGVPYDFDLTRRTRLELSNQKIAPKELASEAHKQATVHFVPTSRGNMASSIQITS